MVDPASLTISVLALGFSLSSFAWQHLRKVDSVICTLVANEINDKQGTFQFSVANLGNRPALLRDVQVQVFSHPELFGNIIGNTLYPSVVLPQVIKAGEIVSLPIETKWTMTDLVLATKQAEQRGCPSGMTELFFVAKVTVWNPEGRRFIATKQIANATLNHKDRTFECQTFNERSFQVSKQFGVLGSERLETVLSKLREDIRS